MATVCGQNRARGGPAWQEQALFCLILGAMSIGGLITGGRARPEAADPLIRVSVATPDQLYNSIDPSPFHARDLDESAERFILEWARDATRRADISLEVRVTETGDGATDIAEAVRQQFRRRADTVSRELRELLRRGRIATVIGLTFLTLSVVLADLIVRVMGHTHAAGVTQEGLHLLGWVSTWKPIEIFLYGWWPLVEERRLYDRLARMPIRVLTPSGEL